VEKLPYDSDETYNWFVEAPSEIIELFTCMVEVVITRDTFSVDTPESVDTVNVL